jgi:hypothetical protein
MIFKKAIIPLILVFLIGVLGFVLQYISHPVSGEIQEEVSAGFKVIGGFGIFLGAYSLLHMHVTRIRRRLEGWGYSMFVFLGAAFMIIVGLYNGGHGPLKDVPPTDPEYSKLMLNWGYNYIYVPCSATIFSILAFFMASAAFRTFRARNLAAALLLIAALIVMFGRVPVSEWVSWKVFGNKDVFSAATDFIMEGPNLAAKRGITLGISLGAISQCLRILLGIERSYLGGGD